MLAARETARVEVDFFLLLEGDEQTGGDTLLLEGDAQDGTESLGIEGDEAATPGGTITRRVSAQ